MRTEDNELYTKCTYKANTHKDIWLSERPYTGKYNVYNSLIMKFKYRVKRNKAHAKTT